MPTNGKNSKEEQVSQNDKKIFLSACYIVKNDADNLRRSLAGIAGAVDEIVVVDTGSGDNTTDIAKAYAARCFSFQWVNDFSAARNFALDRVRGEWVLFLDSDEYFAEPLGNSLRKLLENTEADQFMLFWRNIEEDTGEILLDSYAPRLFRNRPDFRYEGRIHEELLCGGKPIQSAAVIPGEMLILMHTGYSKRVSKEKAARNLTLLLEELKVSRHPERLYMYLVEAYEGLEEYEQAVAYAEKDISTGRKPVVFASRSYRSLLRILAKKPMEGERRLKAAKRAVEDFPEIPEFHAEYAECLAAHGRYKEALSELEMAEQRIGKDTGWEPNMFPEEMRPVLETRRQQWEAILEEEGKLEENEIQRALLNNPRDEELLEAYCDMYEDEVPGELAARLINICGGDRGGTVFLMRWAERYGRISLYKEFRNILGTSSERDRFYEKQGENDYQEVLNLLFKEVKRLPRILFLLERDGSAEAPALYASCRELLPPAMRLIWKAYEEGSDCGQSDDGYDVILEAAIRDADDNQLLRLVETAGSFDSDYLNKVGTQLMEGERWQAAFAAYSRIQDGAECVNGEFWYNVGRCLYYLGERDSAEECMNNALKFDPKHYGAKSYLTWIEEEKAGC